MNLLALDLGTKTGYAYSGSDGKMICGTWTLARSKEITSARRLRMDRRCDPRFGALIWEIKAVQTEIALDYILFEDVQFSSTTMQTQLWASFRAAVWTMQDYGIQIDCVPVGTLKKFATGNGAATKGAMEKSLVKQDFRFTFDWDKGAVLDTQTAGHLDDNAVDAIHLYRWGLQHLRK